MHSNCNVARYLLSRLQEIGVRHLFGVPGDYVLDFLDEVIASPIQWVGNCNELNAGYAADGYARLNGVGGAVVTYGVGGMSILNAVAGAFAERVPLVVISGAPPARSRETGALVHHLIANYYLQLEIFKKVTADAAVLLNADTAPAEIDRVLSNCLARKMPVYLELPADMVRAPCCPAQNQLAATVQPSDEGSLAECVEEAAAIVNCAQHPLVLAGVELARFKLAGETLRLVETAELPFATMLSSKALLPELHPQFVGIYQGGWSRESVRRQVEDADCVLSLGVWMTDLDTGMFSIRLDPQCTISAAGNKVRIGHHYYDHIQLKDFLERLAAKLRPRSYLVSHPAEPCHARTVFQPEKGCQLTARRLYTCLNYYLNDQMVLLAEPGDAFCAAPEFNIEEAENFVVQSYYAAIGYCTPAALGVGLACPAKRPVVLTGDGAFQMTAQEVSVLIRQHCPAVIIVINNDGYLIERMLHKDGPYNDIPAWRYANLPEVFDLDRTRTIGMRVATEDALDEAMRTVVREKEKLILIEACLPPHDCSPGLMRLGMTFQELQRKK